MRLRHVLAVTLVVCVMIGAFVFLSQDRKPEVFYTTISISDITNKFEKNDKFYVTVVLDDFLEEDLYLYHKELTLQIEKDEYDALTRGEAFVGVSVTVPIQEGIPENDIALYLKAGQTQDVIITNVSLKA